MQDLPSADVNRSKVNSIGEIQDNTFKSQHAISESVVTTAQSQHKTWHILQM